jgi:hypothetical protein
VIEPAARPMVEHRRGLCQGRVTLHGSRERPVFVLGEAVLCSMCILLLCDAAWADFEAYCRSNAPNGMGAS